MSGIHDDQESEDIDIDEEAIYSQMYQAIQEELLSEHMENETPNLDELDLTNVQIQKIRTGGFEIFKQIVQSRFQPQLHDESNSNETVENQLLTGIQSHNHDLSKQDRDHSTIAPTGLIHEANTSQIQGFNVSTDPVTQPRLLRPKEQNENDGRYDCVKQEVSKSEGINNRLGLSNGIKPIQEEQSKSLDNQLSIVSPLLSTQSVSKLQPILQTNSINSSVSWSAKISLDNDTLDNHSSQPLVISPSQIEYKTSPQKQLFKHGMSGSKHKRRTTTNDVLSLSGIKPSQVKSISQINCLSTSNLSLTKLSICDLSKSMHTRSQMNSSLSQSKSGVRSQQEQEQAMSRLFRRHNEVKEKILQKQLEKEEQEMSFIKQKKPMTKASESMVAKISYMKPEQRATHEQRLTQERRREMLEEKVKQEQEKELMECTFHPQILSSEQSYKRSYDQFFYEQNQWLKNKEDLIASQQAMQAEIQMSESTFKPTINKSATVRNLRIEERLLQDYEKIMEKRKQMEEETQPIFKPVIFAKSQELAKKRKERLQASSQLKAFHSSPSKQYI